MRNGEPFRICFLGQTSLDQVHPTVIHGAGEIILPAEMQKWLAGE